jgi:hypothetical protein
MEKEERKEWRVEGRRERKGGKKEDRTNIKTVRLNAFIPDGSRCQNE